MFGRKYFETLGSWVLLWPDLMPWYPLGMFLATAFGMRLACMFVLCQGKHNCMHEIKYQLSPPSRIKLRKTSDSAKNHTVAMGLVECLVEFPFA